MKNKTTLHQFFKDNNKNYELLSYPKTKLLILIGKYEYCNLHTETLLAHLNSSIKANAKANNKVKKIGSARTVERYLAELKELDFISVRRNKGTNQWTKWVSPTNLNTIHNYFGSVVEALSDADIAVQELEIKLREANAKIVELEAKIKVMGSTANEALTPTPAPLIEEQIEADVTLGTEPTEADITVKLKNGTEVLILAENIEYWNQLYPLQIKKLLDSKSEGLFNFKFTGYIDALIVKEEIEETYN